MPFVDFCLGVTGLAKIDLDNVGSKGMRAKSLSSNLAYLIQEFFVMKELLDELAVVA